MGASGLLLSAGYAAAQNSIDEAAPADRPLEGDRIHYAKRDSAIDAAGKWVVSCKHASVRNETRYRNNDISVVEVANNKERILRFTGFHVAYGCAISPDGHKLAVLVQNRRHDNHLVVLDAGTLEISDVYHTPKSLYLMPIFVGDGLFCFRTEPASELTLLTRFMTCTTESNAKDEIYRLYRLDKGQAEAVSDLRFYIPHAIRNSGGSLVLENDYNLFANRYLSDRDHPVSRTEIAGFGRLYQFPAFVPMSVICGGSGRTYLANDNLFSLEVGLDDFVGFFDALNVSQYEGRYRVPAQFEAALNVKAVSDFAVNGYEYPNFLTSCEDRYLFTGVKPGSGAPAEIILCDETMAIVQTAPYYPDVWEVVEIDGLRV
ncbi:hypothetical protein ABI_15970 [Asticcacaulis biprosthecium C19]|uniref:Uncharacterized protein n=1 Tax=Asticcacaulis biprosthecium C19 TaxID=715226 RepID=F4QJH4_9CAUL|nr:hypothetical protein ABI_15970 [Asticcacaulis biprosthecium C19]